MSNIMYTSSVPELSGPSASGPCVQDNQKKGQRHDQTHLHLLASRYQYSPENNSNTWQKMMSGTPKDVSSLALAQAQLQESATYQQQQSAILPPNHAESEATLADDDLLPPLSEPINPQAPQQQQQQQQQNFQQNNQLFGYPEAQSQQYAIAPSCEPRVGDFILTETIGEGTFGKVKLGVHYQNGEKCAVKAIQKSKIKTVKQMNSVQREVRLMKLLKHPHIVDVKETLEDGDQIFLVMEYASGGELFDYIAQQCQQDENMARLYFRQVVSAINYCHHNSIIHRDLKPENLLLDKNGNIKIIDFGFGNTFHRDRTLDTYCGSPYYAAPEMVKGIPYTGPEVDIWSLGVILYALITGNLPFDSRDMSVLYALIAKGEYEPIKTSDTANHLVSTMLMVNPLKRAKMNDVIDHP
ncbi:kinase-like domain-containing protein [Obelidium mucronatum]|nr:kinase-like domain-containing protein [Obelidium mucronatum]